MVLDRKRLRLGALVALGLAPASCSGADPAPAGYAVAVAATAGGEAACGEAACGGEGTCASSPSSAPANRQAAPVPSPSSGQAMRSLTAASVGDVDRRGPYREYLARHDDAARRFGLDMRTRVRVRVLDAQGAPVNDARVVARGRVLGRTHADGVFDLFPAVSLDDAAGPVDLQVRHDRGVARVALGPLRRDREVVVRLDARSVAPEHLDLGFLIDVTGSMEDELRYVNREIGGIVERIRAARPGVRVRVGARLYRDRLDARPLSAIAFTEDVAGFAAALGQVRASGGGDYPEDMNTGLESAIEGLAWSEGNAARVLVLIADAPPKRYANTQYDYRDAMRTAARRGIRILPVAASGADRDVEFLFRAAGAFTSTPYVYLTDDSGIGDTHLEADTDRVAVERFHELIVRMVLADLTGEGMHEPGAFGPSGAELTAPPALALRWSSSR